MSFFDEQMRGLQQIAEQQRRMGYYNQGLQQGGLGQFQNQKPVEPELNLVLLLEDV